MKKTMKVRVTNSDEKRWYNHKIGGVFNVYFKNPKDENDVYKLIGEDEYRGILAKHCEVIEDENGYAIVRELKDLIGLTGDNGFEKNKITNVNLESGYKKKKNYISVNNLETKETVGLWVDDDKFDRLFYKLNNWFGIKCKYQPKAELEEITTIAKLQEVVDELNKGNIRFDIGFCENKICVMETKSEDIGFFKTLTCTPINLEEYGYKINIK